MRSRRRIRGSTHPECIGSFVTSRRRPANGCAPRCTMDDFSAFTSAERAVFEALGRRGVRFMVVGLSAGVLQGANTGTRDIDIWFEDTSDLRIGEAGGIWVSGSFGMRPPQIGGDTVGDRLDVVS